MSLLSFSLTIVYSLPLKSRHLAKELPPRTLCVLPFSLVPLSGTLSLFNTAAKASPSPVTQPVSPSVIQQP